MDPFHLSLTPPELANLAWRELVPEDLDSIVELARACLLIDGGLPFLFEPEPIQSGYFPDRPGTGIGAFSPDGRLAACAAVHLDANRGTQLAKIVGLAHPGQRGKGIGTYLIRWSQAQARRLLSSASIPAGVLQISTESLTESADRLFRAHGFECVMEEVVMRRDLGRSLADIPLPPGATLLHWRPDLAEEFYQAYDQAFRERPGFPGWSAAEWIGNVTENDHIPEWSLLARVDGLPAGFVIGNIDLTTDPPGGYVWQIGVIPSQRRRGLASALLVESLRRMQGAGAVAALLCVHVNNPGAYQAYAQLGFIPIGRRARYERAVE